jgi:hypothetical protein
MLMARVRMEIKIEYEPAAFRDRVPVLILAGTRLACVAAVQPLLDQGSSRAAEDGVGIGDGGLFGIFELYYNFTTGDEWHRAVYNKDWISIRSWS